MEAERKEEERVRDTERRKREEVRMMEIEGACLLATENWVSSKEEEVAALNREKRERVLEREKERTEAMKRENERVEKWEEERRLEKENVKQGLDKAIASIHDEANTVFERMDRACENAVEGVLKDCKNEINSGMDKLKQGKQGMVCYEWPA